MTTNEQTNELTVRRRTHQHLLRLSDEEHRALERAVLLSGHGTKASWLRWWLRQNPAFEKALNQTAETI